MVSLSHRWTIANARYAASVVDVDPVTGSPVHPNNAAGRAVIAAIYLYYLSYNLAMSPLLVSYTVEILPFRIRAKGLMVMQMCVNASLVFNQYANPIAMKALDWKYYISGAFSYSCLQYFEFLIHRSLSFHCFSPSHSLYSLDRFRIRLLISVLRGN